MTDKKVKQLAKYYKDAIYANKDNLQVNISMHFCLSVESYEIK